MTIAGTNSKQIHSIETIFSCSLLIPFRNEKANLPTLLNQISSLETEGIDLEVILINDNSDDGSHEIVERIIRSQSIPHLSLLKIDNGKPSKKLALEQGLKNARHRWIAQTDADCAIHSNWLQSIKTKIHDPVKFIAGPVGYKKAGFWTELIRIESWALNAVSFLGFIQRSPQMCSGANLCWDSTAFVKSDFNKIIRREIPSGDDMFLMNYFNKQFPNSLHYNWSKNGLVETEAPQSFRQFFFQRLRWASKWKHADIKSQKVFPVLILSFHFLNLLFGVLLIIHSHFSPLIFIASLKAFSEYFVLSSFANHFKSKIPLLPFVFLQFLYSIYVLIFGISSQLIVTRWK